MKFTKARMRTGETAKLYKAGLIQRFDNGWSVIGKAAAATGKKHAGATFQRHFLTALDALTEYAEPEPGHTRTLVKKASVDAIRALMRQNGSWDQEGDQMNTAERVRWHRAKEPMLNKSIVEFNGQVWRLPP
jgi:hypothetical protein